MTCSMRSVGDMGEGKRRQSEIRRPMASLTAAVSEPALPTLQNTSNGWSSPFRFTVTNALPRGVAIS